jgi:hypothetical protein
MDQFKVIAPASGPRFEYRYRGPLAAPESRGGLPAEYRRSVEQGMIIERDLPVKLQNLALGYCLCSGGYASAGDPGF